MGKPISVKHPVFDHGALFHLKIVCTQLLKDLNSGIDHGFGNINLGLLKKRLGLSRKTDPDQWRILLIGPLQSNKSEDAVALFDVIQTVDRKKIVRTLAEAAEKLGRFPDLLIQVNTGEEEQKSGVSPAEVPGLIAYTRETYKGALKGLMCIPPVDEPAGPHFALLAKLAAQAELPWVSMGMSADYALAARFGATHVRVGSAFFGERPDPA